MVPDTGDVLSSSKLSLRTALLFFGAALVLGVGESGAVGRFLTGEDGEGVDGGVIGVADLRERSKGGGVLEYRASNPPPSP
jgi:hypothetical protein